MQGPVVVGVDGSTASAKAIGLGVAAATSRGVGVKLVHAHQVPVIASPFAVMTDSPLDDYRTFAERLLEAARTQARAYDHAVPIETVYASGPPAAVLLEASEDASLVVLGNRGLGAVGSIFLGSVSTRVASRAGCPVLVTSDGSRAADNREGPIVVGVDGSGHADGALGYALDAGVRLGSAVQVIAAWDVAEVSVPVSAEAMRELHQGAEQEAAEIIRAALERVRTDRHGDVQVVPITAKGDPAEVLLEASREARLVVIGSRGRGEVRGALLGSVSRTVLKESDQPVVVIHARER